MGQHLFTVDGADVRPGSERVRFDPDMVLPNDELSVDDGAILPWRRMATSEAWSKRPKPKSNGCMPAGLNWRRNARPPSAPANRSRHRILAQSPSASRPGTAARREGSKDPTTMPPQATRKPTSCGGHTVSGV